MTKQLKRIGWGLGWLLAAVVLVLLALTPQALADDGGQSPGWSDPIRVDGIIAVPSGDPGQTVSIVIPLHFSREFGWNSVRDVSVTPVISTDTKVWPFVVDKSPYTIPITFSGNRARATFNFKISQAVAEGMYELTFNLVYVAANGGTREQIKQEIKVYVDVLSDGVDYEPEEEEEEEDDKKAPVVIGAATAPKVKIEKDVVKRVTMEVPVINNSGGPLTDVTIEPVISTELDKFPFVVETQNYKREIGAFPAGEARTLVYDFQVSQYAAEGAKGVEFKVEYTTPEGKQKSNNVTAYVNIEKEKEEEEEEDDDDKKSKPKLIISSYNITPDKVFAGTNFELQMVFTNTSTEAIQNITISIINSDEENAYVVPAKSGSNTIYVRSMGAGASITKTLEMQVRPDTPAKPSMMNVTMKYEDSKYAELTESANITVPINQELRVVVDEPRLDNPYPEVGMTTYAYFNIINMGKSSIYNTTVSVEGQGLKLEESLYAGTIQAGAQFNADIGIICNEPGEIAGEIIVSYEDDFGDTQEERLPIALSVMEPMMPEFPEGEGMLGPDGEWIDPGMDPGMEGGGSSGLLKWVLIGAGVVILVVVIIVVRKRKIKKRQAELMEEDDVA